MKSDSRLERTPRLRNRIRATHSASLLLAVIGVMAVGSQIFVSTARTSTAASLPGDLNAGREGHTATLLNNGKVIIVGGYPISPAEFLDCELYDTKTGIWSITGNLRTARNSHTATLLINGKVLVAAGTSGVFDNNPFNTAELFDPATEEWSTTGNLITARMEHTATILSDGKVLVIGGFNFLGTNFPGVLSSAELYNPETGIWNETGDLKTPRYRHTATLLQNGKVLVAGGMGDRDLIDSAELYDPDTGMWSPAGKINTPRYYHTAALLQNGKVLVAGGVIRNFPIGSAELYDPDTEMWKTTGSLNQPRLYPATVLLSGKVLIAGGNTAELYDPETEKWSLTTRLNAPRLYHTTTLLPDGRVLAAGGSSVFSSVGILKSSELYDPDTETWSGPIVPVITGTLATGKKLVLFGENFGPDAVILRNGIVLQTKNSGDTGELVAKKGAKKIKPGDKLQVLNPTGALSKEFVFAG
ncbi:MAG TPA: kelch repeat-containing protein [Blastocatellia bacterium]|nr:kelch repeat-containing protein [Blastocatellia bacterium]